MPDLSSVMLQTEDGRERSSGLESSLPGRSFREFQKLATLDLIQNHHLNPGFQGMPSAYYSRMLVLVRRDERSLHPHPSIADKVVANEIQHQLASKFPCPNVEQAKVVLVVDILRASDGSIRNLGGPHGTRMGKCELGVLWRLCKIDEGSMSLPTTADTVQPNFEKIVAGGLSHKRLRVGTFMSCGQCGPEALLDNVVPRLVREIASSLKKGRSASTSKLQEGSKKVDAKNPTIEKSFTSETASESSNSMKDESVDRTASF